MSCLPEKISHGHQFFLLFLLFLLLAGFSSPDALAGPLDGVVDVSAAQWRTAPPVTSRLKAHSGHPTRLTIHYTGVKKNPKRTIKEKLRGLFNYSANVLEPPMKKYVWGDVPYHFYIDMNGTVAESRDMKWQPDTNTNYKPDGHITIVVEGDNTDTLSDDQKGKLFALMRALQLFWKIPNSNVGVHKDFASTACPGPAVQAAVREYLARAKPEKKAR